MLYQGITVRILEHTMSSILCGILCYNLKRIMFSLTYIIFHHLGYAYTAMVVCFFVKTKKKENAIWNSDLQKRYTTTQSTQSNHKIQQTKEFPEKKQFFISHFV